MMLSRKSLDNTICIACGKKFIEHHKGSNARSKVTKFSAKELMNCLFRIQASYILDMKKNEEKKNEDKAYYENQMDGQKV